MEEDQLAKYSCFCSFCGGRKNEVEMLIAGGAGTICPVCVDVCAEIIKEKRRLKIEAKRNEQAEQTD